MKMENTKISNKLNHIEKTNLDGRIQTEETSSKKFTKTNENHQDITDNATVRNLSTCDRKAPESSRRQRAGESVEKRPLVLHPKSINTDAKPGLANDKRKSEKETAKTNQQSTDEPNLRATTVHPSSETSTFFSSLTSWKTSAGYVLDSLRDKLNYFRRPRHTEHHSKLNNNNLFSSNHTMGTTNTQNKNPSITVDIEPNTEASNNTFNRTSELNPHHETLSVKNADENSSLQEADVSSTYDNDSTHDPFEINDEKENSSNDQTQTVSPDTIRLNLKEKEIDLTENLYEGNITSKCVRTSMCSPCIGSKTWSKDQILIVHSQSQENIESPTTSDTNNCKVTIMNSPKIIYDQPSNTQHFQEELLATFNDATDDEMFIDGDKSENQTCSRLMTIPDVKLHSATPTCSINQELNLQGSLSEDDISKEDSDSITELLQSYQRPEQSMIAEEQSSNVGETADGKISADNGDTQFNINLWNLRNSLEQSNIERQCLVRGFDDFEGNSEDRRLSLATDGMTEASPLSTPSSEFTNYRGKSISDSEDDGRAYFVTPSGRISPRQPNSHQRSITSFCSSPERSSDEAIPRSECCFVPVENPITSRNYSDPSDLISSVSERNILVTQATIEDHKSNPNGEEPSGLKRNVSEESTTNVSIASTCEEKCNQFYLSPKWSTVSDGDDVLEEVTNMKPTQIAKKSEKSSSLHLLRQASLPLPTERTLMHLPDRIEEQPHHRNVKTIYDAHNKANLFKPQHVALPASNRKTAPLRGRLLHSSNSISSDDVFLSDSQSTTTPTSSTYISTTNYRNTKYEPKQISSRRAKNMLRNQHNFATYSLTNNDTTLVPPINKVKQRSTFRAKMGSATSSGTSSPTSPPSSASEKPILRCAKSVDLESDDSISSRTSSSRSSSSIKSLTKIFRRSNRNRQRSDSVPTFCGYSLERDYCIDVETDRVFKEFLRVSSPATPPPSLPSGEPLPPPSHMVPPPPLKNTSSTQLRRQVMRKQYSDSIAMYYGQQQRRWRFTKQKSDSVNCPIDRGIFRRQDRIDEEFDPEEINERLSSTSSHRDSERPADFVPPTVYELREWRRSSEDRSRMLRHASSLPTATFQMEPTSSRSTRRVTFKQNHLTKPKTRSQDITET